MDKQAIINKRAGHDINYLALSGIAGHSGRQAGGPPPLGIQVADVAGGFIACFRWRF